MSIYALLIVCISLVFYLTLDRPTQAFVTPAASIPNTLPERTMMLIMLKSLKASGPRTHQLANDDVGHIHYPRNSRAAKRDCFRNGILKYVSNSFEVIGSVLAPKSRQLFRLLDLPPEIRQQIYKEALMIWSWETDSYEWRPKAIDSLRSDEMRTPLFYVSRQIARETIPLFCEINHFHFRHFDAARSFFKRIGTSSCSNLTSISLDHRKPRSRSPRWLGTWKSLIDPLPDRALKLKNFTVYYSSECLKVDTDPCITCDAFAIIWWSVLSALYTKLGDVEKVLRIFSIRLQQEPYSWGDESRRLYDYFAYRWMPQLARTVTEKYLLE